MAAKIRLTDGTEYTATVGKDESELWLFIKEADYKKVFLDFIDPEKTVVMTKTGDGEDADISGYTRFHSMVVDTPQEGTIHLRMKRMLM